MRRIPDWAGTEPRDLDEFMCRLSNKTKQAIIGDGIKSLDGADDMRIELARSLWYHRKGHIEGLGRASLKEIEMALGMFSPPLTDIDTSDCWMCNGKMGSIPSYCSRHCAELNKMKGAWRNVTAPPSLKGRSRENHRSKLSAKVINRWLRRHSPTILCDKDAEPWIKRFGNLVAAKEWKRNIYSYATPRHYFYEGDGSSVGQVWVNGEMVKIMPYGAVETMRKMRSVANRAERAMQ